MLSASSLTTLEPSMASLPSLPSSNRRTLLGSTSVTTAASSHTDVFGHGTAPPRSNGRLQVFVDGTVEIDTAKPEPATPWPDIGTRSSRIKENTQASIKPDGIRIKQAGRSIRMAEAAGRTKTSILSVFRDPDPFEEAQTSLKAKAPEFSSAGATRNLISASLSRNSSFEPFRDETVSTFFALNWHNDRRMMQILIRSLRRRSMQLQRIWRPLLPFQRVMSWKYCDIIPSKIMALFRLKIRTNTKAYYFEVYLTSCVLKLYIFFNIYASMCLNMIVKLLA